MESTVSGRCGSTRLQGALSQVVKDSGIGLRAQRRRISDDARQQRSKQHESGNEVQAHGEIAECCRKKPTSTLLTKPPICSGDDHDRKPNGGKFFGFENDR